MDIRGILQLLPHRFPFLLVDRVLQFESGKQITCLKNVTFNELHFMGHFPDVPVMPGVLQLEVMAQAAALCHIETMRLAEISISDKLFMFTNVKNARFLRMVIPGDALIVKAAVLKSGSRLAGYQCSCAVDDQMVSEAEIYAAVVEKEKVSHAS